MVLWEFIDQGFKKLDPFQLGNGIEGSLFKKGQVFLNDIVAKGVEGMNMDLIGVGANEGLESPAHSDGTGIGIGETEDILGENVRFQEDLPDPGGQDLRFARAGPCDHHDGAFDGIDGLALLFIQLLVFLLKMLPEPVPVD